MPDTVCNANGALCGANCDACPTHAACPGCVETNGCPHGKPCFLATYLVDEGEAEVFDKAFPPKEKRKLDGQIF